MEGKESNTAPPAIEIPKPDAKPPKAEKQQQQRPPKGEGQQQQQQQQGKKEKGGQQQNQEGKTEKQPQQSSSSSNAAAGKDNTLASEVFRLALFDHLPRKQVTRDPDLIEEDRMIHPATIQLGLLYHKGVIQSDDDRAHALISTLMIIIQDYKTPPKKVLREDMDKFLGKQVQYLVDNRPISKGMGNIIRYLRQSISKISPELSEFDAKQTLLSKMQTFLDEKMLYAADSITNYVSSTINEEDVILTFGSSPLLRRIFLKIAQTKKFQLIVVDTRPLNEGIQTLAALSQCIKCIYSPLSGIAVALQNVNKVVLGASCLLSNGSMLAPAGTAMVASMATALQIPVLVACESYKFSDKVQLDPIVFNELGHASEIAVMVSAAEAQEYTGNETPAGQEYVALPQTDNKYRGSADKASLLNQLSHNGGGEEYVTYPHKSGVYSTTAHNMKLPYQVVNLRYDLTPLTNISVVATETGLIPPTSVPALIREMQSDAGGEM